MRALLLIDYQVKLSRPIDESYDKLKERVKQNLVLGQMQVVEEDVMVAKALIQGQLGLTETLVNQLWPHLQYPEISNGKSDYTCLLTGLVGLISGQIFDDFNVSKFLRMLHE